MSTDIIKIQSYTLVKRPAVMDFKRLSSYDNLDLQVIPNEEDCRGGKIEDRPQEIDSGITFRATPISERKNLEVNNYLIDLYAAEPGDSRLVVALNHHHATRNKGVDNRCYRCDQCIPCNKTIYTNCCGLPTCNLCLIEMMTDFANMSQKKIDHFRCNVCSSGIADMFIYAEFQSSAKNGFTFRFMSLLWSVKKLHYHHLMRRMKQYRTVPSSMDFDYANKHAYLDDVFF